MISTQPISLQRSGLQGNRITGTGTASSLHARSGAGLACHHGDQHATLMAQPQPTKVISMEAPILCSDYGIQIHCMVYADGACRYEVSKDGILQCSFGSLKLARQHAEYLCSQAYGPY